MYSPTGGAKFGVNLIKTMNDRWKILIAEDNLDRCDYAASRLKKDGNWEPTVARSLSEAKRIIDEGRTFDVALVDLGLGGGLKFDPKSGEELAELLIQCGTKVGLLSGSTAKVSLEIAHRLKVPFFDKIEIDDYVVVAKEILYRLPEGQREGDNLQGYTERIR